MFARAGRTDHSRHIILNAIHGGIFTRQRGRALQRAPPLAVFAVCGIKKGMSCQKTADKCYKIFYIIIEECNVFCRIWRNVRSIVNHLSFCFFLFFLTSLWKKEIQPICGPWLENPRYDQGKENDRVAHSNHSHRFAGTVRREEQRLQPRFPPRTNLRIRGVFGNFTAMPFVPENGARLHN